MKQPAIDAVAWTRHWRARPGRAARCAVEARRVLAVRCVVGARCALAASLGLSCSDVSNDDLFDSFDTVVLPASPPPDDGEGAVSRIDGNGPSSGGVGGGAAEVGDDARPGPSPGEDGIMEPSEEGMADSAQVVDGEGVAGEAPVDAADDPGGAVEPPAPSGPREPLFCPATASFCSSFEEAGLPAGAEYVSQRGAFVAGESLLLDAVEPFSGEQSLLVPASTLAFDYRMLSVAIPGNDFWVRLMVRTDVLFGDRNDDVIFAASALSEGFNGDRALQFSEQFDQIVLNKNGQLHGATRENPNDADVGAQLEPGVWQCLEAFFGGTTGDALVFLDGEPIITAAAWQPDVYATFRFGYLRYNTERNVWIDDVAVAPDRVGCD